MSSYQPNIFVRFLLGIEVFLRVLFDAKFGSAVLRLARGEAAPSAEPSAGSGAAQPPPKKESASQSPSPKSVAESSRSDALSANQVGALQLLRLLQRQGRFVDFIQQDIVSFEDAQVGSAARVVHEGCRKALSGWTVESVSSVEENSALSLEPDEDGIGSRWKLTGNVGAGAAYRGTLRHRGWVAKECSLPELVGDEDPRILAPAELEVA